MAMLVTDPDVEQQLKAEREASGADRYDEVWEGVYMMAPLADSDHQDIVGGFVAAIRNALGWDNKALVLPGVNISDRIEDWKSNYRIPDVAIFFPNTTAINKRTFWVGGPDFAVEIASPGDQTRDKIPFYEKGGARELLLIDRDPWAVEHYVRRGDQLALSDRATIENGISIKLVLVPATLRLVADSQRPRFELSHSDGSQRWMI